MKKRFRKTKVVTLVLIGTFLLSACGTGEQNTINSTEAIPVETESLEATESAAVVVEPVEPDYYFEEEFAVAVGDTVNLEEGISFTLETLDYLTETENYRVDYIMSKDGEDYPGRYFMDKEGVPFQYIEVYNIHPITLIDVNDSQAVFVVSAAPEIPDPLEVSGSVEDTYTTEDYEYVVGDRCILYLDKGVTFRGNIMADLENIMTAVEKESGFEFYVENKYSAMRISGIRESYFGVDPWPGVDEFNEKIAVYVINQPEQGYVSCAYERAIVIMEEDFRIETDGVYAIAHELSHTIHLRNGELLNRKLTEGFACYMGKRVAESLTQYPTSAQCKEAYYGTFPERLNRDTAESIFMTVYEDYAYDFKEYQYGMYFVTYLYETYGEQAFHELLQCVNEKNNENYTSATDEMQVEALKECISENIFAEFGDWYENNKNRFAGE